jgi:hypothetical protein
MLHPENVRGSLAPAEFSDNTGTASYVLEFLQERIMKSAGFRQVWELGVALKGLSMRRQKAQFGFVNEESFQPFDQTESTFNRGIVRKGCTNF